MEVVFKVGRGKDMVTHGIFLGAVPGFKEPIGQSGPRDSLRWAPDGSIYTQPVGGCGPFCILSL